MPFDKIMRSVNDATRTVNSVTNTTRSVQRTGQDVKHLSDSSKQKKQQKQDAKQASLTWTCACGVNNTTKFCGECGKPEPAEVKCVKCKWIRPKESSSMKFCGECGTQFPV